MKVVEDEPRLRVMDGPWTPTALIKEVVDGGQEDPFYVMDLGEVVARYHQWKELMPRVEPFYAVKCNNDPILLRTLAALGTGFDCASKAEIQTITDLGVAPERIIFANPAKMASHIRHAAGARVTTVTFDSDTELYKIKQHMPEAQLVIRIRCDASNAQCPLGIKFGCDACTDAPRLLKLAAVLHLDVVGVSFHVGSGAGESEVFGRGIALAHALFELGAAAGHHMTLLDIGGGFPGHRHSSILEVSEVINAALELHFPSVGGSGAVRVIAEPGRYFAAAAYTLATMVHAKREIPLKAEEQWSSSSSHTMYFINDGVYGSFNCVLYDHQHVTPELLQPSAAPPAPCSIWGPSCDGLDCVVGATRLPQLAEGAWLVFRDMGAYTLPVASPFNGFPVPTVRHAIDHELWAVLKELWPLSDPKLSISLTVPPSPSPPASPSPSSSRSASPPVSQQQDSAHHIHAVFVECALK